MQTREETSDKRRQKKCNRISDASSSMKMDLSNFRTTTMHLYTLTYLIRSEPIER